MMEDDMEILQWPSNRLVYAAPPGWGILQLYGIEWRHDVAEDSAYTVPLQLWVPWGSGLGSTGAYIINRHGMLQVCLLDLIHVPDLHPHERCCLTGCMLLQYVHSIFCCPKGGHIGHTLDPSLSNLVLNLAVML